MLAVFAVFVAPVAVLLLVVIVVLAALVAVIVVMVVEVVVVIVMAVAGAVAVRLHGKWMRVVKLSVFIGGRPGNCVCAGACGCECGGRIKLKLREREVGPTITKLRDVAVSPSIGMPSTGPISHPEETTSSSSGSSSSSCCRSGGGVGGDIAIATEQQTDNTRPSLYMSVTAMSVYFGGGGVRTSAKEGEKNAERNFYTILISDDGSTVTAVLVIGGLGCKRRLGCRLTNNTAGSERNRVCGGRRLGETFRDERSGEERAREREKERETEREEESEREKQR